MLVEEFGHIGWADVFSAFEETSREYGYGVCMGLHKIGHHFCELDLFFQGVYLSLLVGEQSGEGVDIIIVDA